jgi:hypothetical protein
MTKILYIIFKGLMQALFGILRFTYMVLLNNETLLDHYIFYKPPPNPWFKGQVTSAHIDTWDL